MEKWIHQVKLNMDCYSGSDAYSDGSVEEELLQIVQNHDKSEFESIIYDRADWPIYYHLSRKRENILNWFPFTKNDEILEIGAGCGALSGLLCEKGKRVDAVELSMKRSEINANKNRDAGNLTIYVGNYMAVYPMLDRKYDYITLIGVLEYAPSYVGGKRPFHTFLEQVSRLLKPGGKVIIAIENRFGLKYFAGCKEDHLGTVFTGIEGYVEEPDSVKTFNKHELEKLLGQTGFTDYAFYYPYPDYKFPTKIYSDDFLPKKGELVNNIQNFDAHRMVLFDETKAFDSIIESGYFPDFSNSYLVVADRKP